MKTTHYNGPNAHRGSRLSNRKQSALRILMLQYFTHKQLNLPVSHDNTAKYTAEKKTHVNATRGRAQRGVKKDTTLQFHGRWQCSYTTTPFTQLGPLSSYGTEGDRTMEAPPPPGLETKQLRPSYLQPGTEPPLLTPRVSDCVENNHSTIAVIDNI